MNLRTFLDSERGIAQRVATAISQPVQSVYQWANGTRQVPMEHCVPIEQFTERKVSCEELRPDLAASFKYLRTSGAKQVSTVR